MRFPSEHGRSLSGRVVEPAALNPAERSAWDALCRTQPLLASPFFTRPYVEAVAACRPGVRVCVLAWEGRPLAFLPFQFATPLDRLLGSAERVGEEMTDHFGLVAPPGFHTDAATVLRLAGLNQLEASHLDEAQLQLGLGGERPELGLLIDVSAGFAAYWAERRAADKKFHADTSRLERRIGEEVGPLRFVFDSPEPDRELARLIEHKRAQYRRTGTADALAAPWKRDLLYRLAASADPLCSGVLSVLTAGDHWVAAHFGVRHGHLLHYWFPVYNPDMKKYAPGRLLLKRLIETTGETGITLVDCGAGDGMGKRDFANAEHRTYRALWRRRSSGGALCRLHTAVRWRVGAWRQRRIAAALAGSGVAS